MSFAISFIKKYWIIITGIMIFLFLTTFNLYSQYSFNGDPARDTLQSLRILRSQDITIIGPPLSLGQNSQREIYFSSLIYYVTAGMLLISNNSILSTVFIVSLINASGVIPLYLLLKERKLNTKEIIILVSLYITNPLVILYSRILWNPSPQIGIGLWGLYFLKRSSIVFGIIAAIAIYFHYFAIALVLFGFIYYVKEKQYKKLITSFISFMVTLTPFIFFELKNKFYLTNSLIYNLVNNSQSSEMNNEKYRMFLEIPSHLFGIIKDPFTSKIVDIGSYSLFLGIIVLLSLSFINRKNFYYIFFIISFFLTGIASSVYVRPQYLFISLGALVAYCINVKSKLSQAILLIIIIFQLFNTIYIINLKANVNARDTFPTLYELEQANIKIQELHESDKKFNITENITGDARALYLRFFLERDRVSGLQNELSYEGLEELYILTPSLEKTLKEKRWEFTATSNLVKTHEISIGEFTLLRYVQQTNIISSK